MAALVEDSDDGTARSGLYCKLHLFVTAQTERGQSIRVSGSSFMMGRNQPTRALKLVTTPEEYPVWRTLQPIVVPRGVVHTYQYAIFDGGKIRRWEDILPRTVNASQPEVTLRDEYGVSPGEVNTREPVMRTKSDSSDYERESGPTQPEMDELTRKLTREAAMLQGGSSVSELMGGRQLVLVCFHLPVVLRRDASKGTWCADWNDSLISRSDDSVASDVSTVWIGTITCRGRFLTESDKVEIRSTLKQMNCIPIFASQDLKDRAYLGYCKQQLWPSFHNVDILDLTNSAWNGQAYISNPELSWDQTKVGNLWEAYKELSETFGNTVNQVLSSNDMATTGAVVWVHDYHLMLLPEAIAKYDLAAHGYRKHKIIFFLHIPFSTSEVFRSLQNGGDLLRGIIHSDLVGFHAYDHARHFLNACKRNLGLKTQTRNGGMLGVEFEGRTVLVAMRHVSIETKKIERKMAECKAAGISEAIKAAHPGKKVIAGFDTCQRLSGVALKLLGIEQLLDEHPKWRDKVVLLQRCLRPGSRPDDEEKTSSELRLLTDKINAKYPGSVIYDEIEGSRLTSGERLGLWLASDVLLNTCVREGLNLDCFEYVYVKSTPGVMVQSEFSSTVSVLNGAMRINPFDVKNWVLTLDTALNMPEAERCARKVRDIGFVTSRPSNFWTKQILNDLASLDSNITAPTNALKSGLDGRVGGVGGTGYLYVDEQNPGMNEDGTSDGVFSTGSFFSRLDGDLVAKAYANTNRRVFIFDYGGTLLVNENVGKYIKDDINPCHKGRELPPQVILGLKALSEDCRNTVYVISGLAQKSLEYPFRDAQKVGLAAQNGLCYTLRATSPTEPGIDDTNVNRIRSASAPASKIEDDISSTREVRNDRNDLRSAPVDNPSFADSRKYSNVSISSLGSSGGSMDGSGGGDKPPCKRRSIPRGKTLLPNKGSMRPWYMQDFGVDWATVLGLALPILNRYTGRTNGSSIRYRDPSVAWSYYRTDPEWGIMQANKLKTELEQALAPFNVQVQHDRGELEIVPKQMHKGTFVKQILHQEEEANGGLPPDFIFVIGDDVSDERMFSSVLSYVAGTSETVPSDRASAMSIETPNAVVDSSSSHAAVSWPSSQRSAFLDDGRVFTCTVGKKPSVAGCFVETVGEVHNLIQTLTKTNPADVKLTPSVASSYSSDH